MAAQILNLTRGGYSVYGGTYDERADEAILGVHENEVRAITITFPSAVSSVSKTQNGITSTTPSITGSYFTATLSAMNDQGSVLYTTTLTSGEVIATTVRAIRNPRTGQVFDYGWWR